MAALYKRIFISCEFLVRLVMVALLTYSECKESGAHPIMHLKATSTMLRLGSKPNLHKIIHNFSLIHNIKHKDINSLLALNVDKMGNVTYFERFIGLRRN